MENKIIKTKNNGHNNKEANDNSLWITLNKNNDPIINESLSSFVEKIIDFNLSMRERIPATDELNKLPVINLMPEN